jgi:pimeloyl-ACP methyl ester carboxylesterase
MSGALRIQQGGQGEPVLLLLHGLGASGDVWSGLADVLARRWPGRWLAPDLPGHGGSARASGYSFGQLAAAVAGVLPAQESFVALGHSLGGVVALALASGDFAARPRAVCGLGIKLEWSTDELARAQALAARPQPVYATRREAAERHLKLAGLSGLVAPDAVPDAVLAQTADGYGLAFDSAAFAIGAPDMAALLAAARAPVVLAAGERDPMCSAEQLRKYAADPVLLSGLGHNAHVESPEALWPLLERLLRRSETAELGR